MFSLEGMGKTRKIMKEKVPWEGNREGWDEG